MIELIMAASLSSATKEFLTTDPKLAGARIDYCLNEKDCRTIDRTKETGTQDPTLIVTDLTTRLTEISNEVHSVSVNFKNTPGVKLNLKFSNDDRKN